MELFDIIRDFGGYSSLQNPITLTTGLDFGLANPVTIISQIICEMLSFVWRKRIITFRMTRWSTIKIDFMKELVIFFSIITVLKMWL